MLGLKLKHVSKRGHWQLEDGYLNWTANIRIRSSVWTHSPPLYEHKMVWTLDRVELRGVLSICIIYTTANSFSNIEYIPHYRIAYMCETWLNRDVVMTLERVPHYWLLTLCYGNSSVTSGSLRKSPIMRSFDVFSVVIMNMQMNKQLKYRRFETP